LAPVVLISSISSSAAGPKAVPVQFPGLGF
jgi:hypothetical protein